MFLEAAMKISSWTVKDAEVAIQKWLRRSSERAKNENKN